MSVVLPSKYLVDSVHPTITTLKLGRNVHKITKKDLFFDNGACVQLLKEHPMKVRVGELDTVSLQDEHLEHIAKFHAVEHVNHPYAVRGNRVWSIVEPDERFLVMGYEDEADVQNRQGRFLGGEGYFQNALKLLNDSVNSFYMVKIFDRSGEQVIY
ncbi:hypothetical protein [Pseudoalteromonas marina]|uniref:Uncharacterized protein n=1 Tax=Pseudoalteromonas marina TaxID=267375 RepID=A0ABT9FCK8_9GAMM|nr:hypothetical protein [Pseudoalteromonas marina]MDP2564419.1 hypothetical protein [Pseudoalteromonas marina]